MTKANYPFAAAAAAAPAIVANGAFVPGNVYKCVTPNPKAKKGENGAPRFTADTIYMCVANATSTSETSGRPPVFLVDNNFRAVNCGADAKLKTTFIDA